MSELKLTVSEIKELMEKMADTGLTAVQIKDGDFELSLKAEQKEIIVQGETAAVAAIPAAAPVPAPKKEEVSGNIVKSPIVGTFYAAPSPDKAPFVSEGKTVKKGDVLFIIESMKLMNEIQSEFDGKVKKILVQDGQPVEYGQPILIIE
ncbi:MAG: acetyl-CoA carboxylase biotin carboxyl carrier protein [Candidatus Merdivicinus sp.]|jgi:acetyl-CoA carboxylase biotin carboxyl carrier protein